MSLTLAEIFDKVKAQPDPRYGLLQDGHIFYLVLNDGNNAFDYENIDKLHKYLDHIEASTGPAVLVTISAS